MKISYIDLQCNNPKEKYWLNVDGYGGAACFARYALTLLNNNDTQFDIIGSVENFIGIETEEKRKHCITLSEESLAAMRHGAPLKDHIPNAEQYDLFVFHHDCMSLNTNGLRGKAVSWSLMGDAGAQHPSTPYVLLYRPGEQARYGKGFPIVIGKYVPPTFRYSPNRLRHGIFQCSRHDVHMNSIAVAQFCLEHKITGIFAGPILDNYPLLKYIDDETTIYLGLISENLKNYYAERAVATTYLHTWDTAFNLSAIESLAVGIPIIAANRGCFKYLVKEGINGFYWNPGDNLLDLYNECKELDSEEIWKTALPYSHVAMVDSFYKAFKEILEIENAPFSNFPS